MSGRGGYRGGRIMSVCENGGAMDENKGEGKKRE